MKSQPQNLKKLPTNIYNNQELIKDAIDLGSIQTKVILIQNIALGNWIKLQCQFGCSFYGRRHTCPSFTPSSFEMAEILLDYQKVLIVESTSTEFANNLVLSLEKRFKQKGMHKAFALGAAPCNLCETCDIEESCKYPEKARPTIKACGIDIFQTLNNVGWVFDQKIEPCSSRFPLGMVLVN